MVWNVWKIVSVDTKEQRSQNASGTFLVPSSPFFCILKSLSNTQPFSCHIHFKH